ncbi:MAG TPA: DUF1854 domain-containing protein [Hyphomicrobiaceae bacterium]|nr:DUF1854 domain-containing protein [Hyphomicrobiaceae bacterium]
MDLQISRNAFGRLELTVPGGVTSHEVTPIRASPIAAPERGISLMGSDGHELLWIERLADMPEQARTLIEEELASREFVPEIKSLRSVTSFATPSTWQVETDRGDTSFVLKGEEDIRRLGGSTLLIADSHGVQFLIRDLAKLDKHSRRLLDRFL